MRTFLALAAVGSLLGCGNEPQPVDSARVEMTFLGGEVSVSGLPEDALVDLARAEVPQLRAVLSVHTQSQSADGDTAADLPAVLGTWLVEDDRLSFLPRFPWAEGMSYEARLDLEALATLRGLPGPGSQTLVAEYQQPRLAREPTEVESIFPSSSQVPTNLLKFYIKFSDAMRRGVAYRHLRLRDLASDELVEAPFLELEQELWDPSGSRLTLFLHPGRIKRGLRPNAEEGLAFAVGGHYRLEIDASWRDLHGQPLAADRHHEFTVLAADRQVPTVESWSLEEPASGTREALEVAFGEALDYGLLRDALTVLGPDGATWLGSVEIFDQERRWRFVPVQPWQRGDYELRVSTRLEDLAGNTPQRLFDVDLQQGPQPTGEVAIRQRSFQVR